MRQPIDHAGMVCPVSGIQAQGEGVAVFDVEIPADDGAAGAVRLKTWYALHQDAVTVRERMAGGGSLRAADSGGADGERAGDGTQGFQRQGAAADAPELLLPPYGGRPIRQTHVGPWDRERGGPSRYHRGGGTSWWCGSRRSTRQSMRSLLGTLGRARR